MNSAQDSPGRPGTPPPQDNLDRAITLGFEALARQSREQLLWLGAEPSDAAWRLPVLDDVLIVDSAERTMTTSQGERVGPHWGILVLHYLAIQARPESRPPEIIFADLETARTYAGIYQGRVVARLCATAGRKAQTIREAAAAVGGRPAQGGDATFDFDPFPRVSLRLIWHAPDDEFPPSATLLLPDNIESYFCAEDIVVLSESLVARLGGRPF